MITSLTQFTQVRLINLRWLSVLAMFIAALVSPNLLGSAELLPRLLAFATVVGCINACLHAAVIFNTGNFEEVPLFSPMVQLSLDLTAWGGYVYLSGGATNPLISVFLPLVAIGACVLGRLQAWLLGLAAILAYSFLWRFYQPLAIRDAQTATQLHLLGMWMVYVVSAVVVIWFILQITQAVRERDAELAAAREQAIRNDWLISMGSLAAGAAHELSTPLATLNLLVDELLADATVSPALRPDLSLMQRQIEVCKQALTQLAQRAGQPRGLPQSAELNAGQWLRNVLGAWLVLNPEATLVSEISPGLERKVLAFDLAVERALANLLDNALKAGAAHIALKAGLEQGVLVLTVDDDGCGILPAALLAFARGLPIVSPTGMGIGLLLARAALERRGGRLELAALSSGGTRARVFVPCSDIREDRREP